MKTLGALLGSAARTEVLRALIYQPGTVGLRQVARIAGVHPHSAELALVGLVKEGLVRRGRAAISARYELNRSHADVAVLEAVFLASAHEITIARNRCVNERSKSILVFIKQATRMLARARETRHVA